MNKIRLLVCQNCKTIEEIPDYEGHPRDDHLLEYLLEQRHTFPDGNRHFGNLYDIEEDKWKDPSVRLEVIKEIKARSGKGFGDDFYSVKATFQEDAGQCWRKHNQTRKNCADYRSKSKALVPNTWAERKELGLGKPQALRYLCDFCPYSSIVMQRQRAAKGYYDYKE